MVKVAFSMNMLAGEQGSALRASPQFVPMTHDVQPATGVCIDRLTLWREKWLNDVAALSSNAKWCQETAFLFPEIEADDLSKVLGAFSQKVEEDPEIARTLSALGLYSPFLGDLALRHPLVLAHAFSQGASATLRAVVVELDRALTDLPGSDLANAMKILRQARARVALLIAVADVAGVWTLADVTAGLSDFADAAVSGALNFLLRGAHEKGDMALPEPVRAGQGCGLFVLAMGKLGAHELNYSSDIDLIIFFDPEVVPYTGKLYVKEAMVRMVQNLVKLLHERTRDGYVFRTDLRLRPDPGSNAVAMSTEAALTYYETMGQNWERSAMIKARPVAGDREVAQRFLSDLEPFIWRRSLDFCAIEDVHAIKRQINAVKGGSVVAVAGHNIKLGKGGIREIEFFAQVQQLIWGGRLPDVRVPATLAALKSLTAAGFITEDVLEELTAAYDYLRTLEHRLQMVADEQTQTMPDDDDGLTALAGFMGFANRESLEQATIAHLRRVEDIYAHLFEDSAAPGGSVYGNLVFTGADDDPETLQTLKAMGFDAPATVCSVIRGWHHGRYRATRADRARQVLTAIIPALLDALSHTAQPDAAFMNFDRLLARLSAGVQLFSMFQVNPHLLTIVAQIMGDAPELAEQLSADERLLDYVISPDFADSLANDADITDDLCAHLTHARDYEDALEQVRRWAGERHFRVALNVLHGKLDATDAAHCLTAVATAALRALVPAIEQEFQAAQGRVPGGCFAIIALGKLGSQELMAGSDLDVVPVYDAPPGVYSDHEKRTLPASAYYMRFTQRLVTALEARTARGRLFEVDLRLRPNGDQGPVATSFEALTHYYAHDAWTWELMAFTRARCVAGSGQLAASVMRLRTEVITTARDASALRKDVLTMRTRMRKELPTRGPWDLKRMGGGLTDVEFIAQYLVLRHASDHTALAEPTDTQGMLTALENVEILTSDDAERLRAAHRFYSRLMMILRLTVIEQFDPTQIPAGLRDKLARAVNEPDMDAIVARGTEHRGYVKATFADLIGVPSRTTANPNS